MLTKRDAISKVMDYSGVLKLVSRYKRTNKESLTILAYHRVVDYSFDTAFDFDEELISASPNDFEKQVKWLKKYFNIISFDSLANKRNVSNSLIITFDDGYKDNYKNAYPVLQKYNVPATIFISTGYIGTNRLFWWDEIAYLVKKTAKNKFVVNLQKSKEYILSTENDRKVTIYSLLKLAKSVTDEQRKEMLRQLEEKLEVDIEEEMSSNLILNWDEIREMSDNGIEFGAHSVTHPILSHLETEALEYEIKESKKAIEREVGKQVTTFSYPVGGNNSFDERSKPFLQQAGYLLAVTYVHGVNKMPGLDKYLLKRIHVEKEDNFSVFKSKILFPDVMKY